MKKIVFASFMSALSLSSVVNAGEMGESSCAPSGFGVIEGGYTYNKIDGLDATLGTTSFSANKKQNQYTFRLAAGAISMIDDSFGLTGELGWGYYGRTTFDLPSLSLVFPGSNFTSKYTLSGFDALVGAAWVQTYYSLSLKVGGLIQNMQVNNTASFVDPSIGIFSVNHKSNQTTVLPALKLGAAYNVDSNWAITASWLFAFGASNGVSATYNPNPIALGVDINTQNPMTNSFMLGVQYSA